MGIRSFLAFELPGEIKSIVTRVSGEIRKSSLEVRRVRPEFIHLTVVFMGDMACLPNVAAFRRPSRNHG